MNDEKKVVEYDSTKTWLGLPAPQGWHITNFIWRHDKPSEKCGYEWETLFGAHLKVWEDITVKEDGKRWFHVSISKKSRKIPSWDEVLQIRKLFIGEDRESYMVFPTKERYVNIHNVLHLWSRMDAPDGVLPHFEKVVSLDGKTMLSI